MPTKHSLGKQAKGVNFNRVKGYARKMRDNPTPAEAKFHQYLKEAYLGHISAQHHFVGRRNAFILDFYLTQLKIGFEIDGWHHYNDPIQIAKDKFRDNYCRVHRIRIIRLKNHEAMDKAIAQAKILKAIGAPDDMVALAQQPLSAVRLRKRNGKTL